ncbi:phasin family protein [Pseudomonas sp. dw_358]|uniref:phasin family protein n=1 Tax=Pseudomonas sp. dw_358 TaxID=2720083 RepID=UPI001BD2972C|nr:phasin family protein [Pseudomonas sp. dw_358]
MAGKKKVEKEGSSWVGGIEKYSRQIWLAGLGAYSKISADGTKLFENLVKDGEKAEKQVKTEVDTQVDTVKASTKSRVGDVKDRALGKWGELEEAFDKRLNSAISRLGVPSRNEVVALHHKVDLLTREIEKLTGTTAKPVTKAAPRVAAKPAPAKTATKAVASKAATAKTAVKAAAKPVAKAVAKAPATAKTSAAKSTAAKKPAAPRKRASPATSAANSATPHPAPAPAATPEASPAS